MLNVISQLKIYTKRTIVYTMHHLEDKCVLPESSKTARRWQRSSLLVKGGHCVGDCNNICMLISYNKYLGKLIYWE